jgi:disulfide bond formation protein DsbB
MNVDPPPATAAAEAPFGFAYAAWFVALTATLGSLFLGEVMKLPPCSLCWYQRICLYPLTLVIAVGIVLRDRRLVYYALPLVLAGLGIAVFHNLLYYGVIDETLSPCTAGVPCSSRQIDWLGFIGIPLLSLAAFVAILLTLLAHQRAQRLVIA